MSAAPDHRRAAEMAARVLIARRVRALPVSPLQMLHACRDTRVYTLDGAADALGVPAAALLCLFRDTDAVTLRRTDNGNEQYIVVFRADGNPARLRFTLAHELGHRILKHTGASPAEEAEADCFASHLLCPEPVLDRLRTVTADGMTLAERVAQHCYVTLACARMALRRRRIPLRSAAGEALDGLCNEMMGAAAAPKDE